MKKAIEETPVDGLIVKAANCAVLHIDTLRRLALKEEAADFAEPCRICKRSEECRCDWGGTLQPILDLATVKIRMDSEDEPIQ